MTAIQAPRTPAAPGAGGRLGDRLEPVHQACLRELQALLDAATTKDPDIWGRWNAVRYIDTVFSGRFDRERLAIQRLDSTFSADDADRLWVTGELVAALRWRLRNTVGLCHHEAEFAALGAKLLRAVGCWFNAVEAVVGERTWDDTPAPVRDDVMVLENGMKKGR